jgi:hypothetical protein
VAGADELVLGLVPGHDAAQVRAHGVQAVALDRLVLLHDQVRRVTLQALSNASHHSTPSESATSTIRTRDHVDSIPDDGDPCPPLHDRCLPLHPHSFPLTSSSAKSPQLCLRPDQMPISLIPGPHLDEAAVPCEVRGGPPLHRHVIPQSILGHNATSPAVKTSPMSIKPHSSDTTSACQNYARSKIRASRWPSTPYRKRKHFLAEEVRCRLLTRRPRTWARRRRRRAQPGPPR